MLFFPICIESFTTVERSIALGFTASFGRLGALIAPYCVYDLYKADMYSQFLIYAFCSLIIYISMATYPIENTGKGMENKL